MKLKVKAAKGVRVPVEGYPHRYIEQESVEIESSIYYQRRIADGDLIVVTQVNTKKEKVVNHD
ncbi:MULTISPECIES: DUF2635 domain-containing protein [Glaesserella]|uniref:DUF2635 domain-containing protein n=1 Tax=Glaesserella australis TaxID=2094024 RepID=A0A328BWR3_9PAST|nr:MULTISPECIES: DUF2635 domain-containing protein [Glaesserella]AUI66699.1 DUF2635 domain-containing protein [Glaesserella sp. 15-184]RAL17907.1 DUF2635 domain-containing protein [Glaesserella australis]